MASLPQPRPPPLFMSRMCPDDHEGSPSQAEKHDDFGLTGGSFAASLEGAPRVILLRLTDMELVKSLFVAFVKILQPPIDITLSLCSGAEPEEVPKELPPAHVGC